jgi:hypothetical protein
VGVVGVWVGALMSEGVRLLRDWRIAWSLEAERFLVQELLVAKFLGVRRDDIYPVWTQMRKRAMGDRTGRNVHAWERIGIIAATTKAHTFLPLFRSLQLSMTFWSVDWPIQSFLNSSLSAK